MDHDWKKNIQSYLSKKPIVDLQLNIDTWLYRGLKQKNVQQVQKRSYDARISRRRQLIQDLRFERVYLPPSLEKQIAPLLPISQHLVEHYIRDFSKNHSTSTFSIDIIFDAPFMITNYFLNYDRHLWLLSYLDLLDHESITTTFLIRKILLS